MSSSQGDAEVCCDGTSRGHRVMLDRDLAELYGVPTKALNQSVARNIARFPAEFMFQLTAEEFRVLKSQFVTSNEGRGGSRRLPLAFTEHGVAMLSIDATPGRSASVPASDRAKLRAWQK